MNYVWFDLIMIPIQVIIVFYTLYYFVLMVCGMWHKSDKTECPPKHSFAIIVCAHNESAVIGQWVNNLQVLDYPRHLYDIFVVADNCKDDTAKIAREAGAEVYERFNTEEVGKGYAMGWMFDKVFAMEHKYDAFVIFDADNLVHPHFLYEMNRHLEKGEPVIQGYLNAKNPTDTWVAGTFAIVFWMVNHMWHLAKYNLGLSTALGGTGMCIRTDIIRDYGWSCNSLTEDMEFSMKVLLEGVRTCWAHDAIIYDEKVVDFMASCRQRKRWAQGQTDCGERFIPKLFVKGIRTGNIRMLDGIITLSQPFFMMMSTIYAGLSYINTTWYVFYTNILNQLMPMEIWTVLFVAQYAIPVIVLLKIKVPLKSWVYLIVYPLFMYSWIPVNFLGFKDRHDMKWSHTVHTRAVSYDSTALLRKENKK